MTAHPLRLGIIGAGEMGRAHETALRGQQARVVAVHDLHGSVAQALAHRAGAELATESLEEFFATPLDGVILTTPPPVRREPIEMACERGIHLFVEKPPALTLAEGRRCLAAIEKAKVIAGVGFNLRYAPLYELLQTMLVGREVHLVRTVCTIDYYHTFRVAPWFLQNAISGGPIAEQAIHLLDCVRFLLGNAAPVQAAALAVKNMALHRPDLDSENAIQVIYELEGGVLGTHLNHCGTEKFAFDLELVGPHLRLQANLTDGRVTGYLDGQPILEPAPQENALRLDKIGAWLRAIETHNPLLVRSSYADALQTLALVEAATRSKGTGRFVRVEELEAEEAVAS